jgi:hypothetical protein
MSTQFKIRVLTTGGTGGSATVRNSDNSYNVQAAAGTTLTLPDVTYNIFVNSIQVDTFVHPSLSALTINISA